MNLHIANTTYLSGIITPPSSKSQTVRAIMFALLSKGTSTIRNILESDDTTAALECVQVLGARVDIEKTADGIVNARVRGNGLPLQPVGHSIFTRNSGITTRFLLPLLGLADGLTAFEIDCGEQMRARPMEPLVDALRSLGVTIEYNSLAEQYPMTISGRLGSGSVQVDGTTSQYVSALLIALPFAAGRSEIFVSNLNERPYVEMTARWLDMFGLTYQWTREGAADHYAMNGSSRIEAFDRVIPGDFSSASALIAAGVLASNTIRLEGLDMSDSQGDKRLISIVKEMGADIEIDSSGLTIRGGKELVGIRIDCNDVPDLVPVLSVIATRAKGVTELVNVPQARLKETDRLHSMTTELAKMGARITELEDGLRIETSELTGTSVHGWSDHRTVMALSVAGLIARGETVIDTAESISKTYPNFVRDMQVLGAEMRIIHNANRSRDDTLLAGRGERAGMVPERREGERARAGNPGQLAGLAEDGARTGIARGYRFEKHLPMESRNIILIGFKHVGKTRIGRELANLLNLQCIDVDDQISAAYARGMSCREIMREIGEAAFRDLEHRVFASLMSASDRHVISTGGGLPLDPRNRDSMSGHTVLTIDGDKDEIYERIMAAGVPPFFSGDMTPREAFEQLWNARMPIYQQCATHTIVRRHTPKETALAIIELL